MEQARPSAAKIVEFINGICPISQETMHFMQQHIFPLSLKKGQYLLQPGEICGHYYYINKGILRSYIKYGSKDITVWINPENEITTSIRSMTRQQPSDEYIQAVEDCELFALSFEAVREMYERFPDMNQFARILLELYYAETEERVYIGRIPNANARYAHFIQSRPELVNRIPLKYVASYLGITLETLSRLRAKQARKTVTSKTKSP